MSGPAPAWAGFCSRLGCPCQDPDPAPCPEWVVGDDGDRPNPRCARCGWPPVSHGLDPAAACTTTDPLHLQARLRAALLGHPVTVRELAPNLRGEPRFVVQRGTAGDPPLGVILDAIPPDLDRYVTIEA